MPITFTSSGVNANDGWNLAGNPYPCSIDWNLVQAKKGIWDFSDPDYNIETAYSNGMSITANLIWGKNIADWAKKDPDPGVTLNRGGSSQTHQLNRTSTAATPRRCVVSTMHTSLTTRTRRSRDPCP